MRSLALAAALLALCAAPAAAVSPADRAAIVDAVTAIAAGADRGQWERVRAAFADEVRVDYTSLAGGEPATLGADALVASWRALLPGFDATQHLVTNHVVTLAGPDAAEAEADFQATHRIGAALWTLGGRYAYALRREGGAWKVTALTMTASWESGDRALLAQAGRRARGERD